jgi:hypothetical protein
MAKSKGKKKRGGRPKGTTGPNKLTERVQKLIIEALILGEPLEIAANRGRIAANTFLRWRKEGKRLYEAQEKGATISEDEKPLVDFHIAIEDALIESEVRAAQAIDIGFTGIKTPVVEEKYDKVTGNLISRKEYEKFILYPDWKAAESKLARRYPDRWGNKDKITHEASKDNPIMTATLADFVKNAAMRARERAAKEKEGN